MMKNVFILFVFTLFSMQTWAQAESSKTDGSALKDEITKGVVFPGCEEKNTEEQFKCFNLGILKIISKNLVYPEEARNMQWQDKVWVSFDVDENGDIVNVELQKGKYEPLNNEALRLVKLFPKMKPAEIDGKPVKMTYTIPINFRLG